MCDVPVPAPSHRECLQHIGELVAKDNQFLQAFKYVKIVYIYYNYITDECYIKC